MSDAELRSHLIRRRDRSSETEYADGTTTARNGSSQKSPVTWRRSFQRLVWPRRRCACISSKCCLVVLIFAFIVYLLLWLPIRKYFWLTNHATRLAFLQHDDCPACFGQSMCNVLQGGAIQLKGIYQYPIFHSYNVRNVLHGVWRRGLQRDEAVLLKKLGHATHIRTVHRDICFRKHGFDPGCVVRGALWSHLSSDGDEQVSLKMARETRSDLAGCLSERLLERLKGSYAERSTSPGSEMFLRHDQLQFFYTLKVNPEPLLLQAFPYNRQLWPFVPRYHGACGQWVVVENRGQTLASFVASASLSERVSVAIQLLQMAHDFTEGIDDFTFYIGDPDWENIVVDPELLRVSLIDLSNLLVVDRRELKMPGGKSVYLAPFDPCYVDKAHSCRMTWDIDHLCDAKTSDYNFYVVCRVFLSPSYSNDFRPGGLLPDLSSHRAALDTDVSALMDRCARPVKGESRITLGKQLLALLRKLNTAALTTP